MREIVIRIQLPEGSTVGVAVPQITVAEQPPPPEVPGQIALEEVARVFPGAQPVAQPVDAPPVPPCPVHMVERVFHAAGTNRKGEPISASWRCPVKECRGQTIWITEGMSAWHFLTFQDRTWADEVGEERFRHAVSGGMRDRMGEANEEPRWHRLGARGELAFCRIQGIAWKPDLYAFAHKPDVAPCFEVRTSVRPRLMIRLHEPGDARKRGRRFCAMQGDADAFLFLGWAWAAMPWASHRRSRARDGDRPTSCRRKPCGCPPRYGRGSGERAYGARDDRGGSPARPHRSGNALRVEMAPHPQIRSGPPDGAFGFPRPGTREGRRVLFWEVKAQSGSMGPEQWAWMRELGFGPEEMGSECIRAEVVRPDGLDEAIRELAS